MARLWLAILVVVAVGTFAVARLIARPPAPSGYSGLEFARVTSAAASRAPLLTTRGALVLSVAEDSPAYRAGIRPGAVVAEIDGEKIASARQASDIVRRHRQGDHVTFTLFDEARGMIRPREVTVIFQANPPKDDKVFRVHPPRILAKEHFQPPSMAANAAWSRRLAHGVSIRPRALPQLNAGTCSGVAPEKWRVADFGPNRIHLTSADSGDHAIYKLVRLDQAQLRLPKDFVLGQLHAIFKGKIDSTPAETRPFGFGALHFGNRMGVAGFALWRINGEVLSLWIAGVPAADTDWALPITAASLLSLRCQSGLAPAPRPRDPKLAATAISVHCLEGRCEDSDFAATYLEKFHLGYVHAHNGDVFLVNPRRDLWLTGQEGPGFYRQLGGANEKLLAGRTN
jgi:PDZ domain